MVTNKTILLEVIKNFRFLQITYHIGLLFIGIGLSYFFVPFFKLPNLSLLITLIIAVSSSWISSVFFNDVADFEIDKISNPHRPLPKGILSKKQSLNIAISFLFISLISTLFASKHIFTLIVFYHVLSWIYNTKPFRFKTIPIIATFIASIASIVIISIGFLATSTNFSILKFLPTNIVLSLIIGYTLSLPIKDLKDLEGDKNDGVKTIPVIFGIKKARILIGINIFVSFVLSALLINFKDLILPALILGFFALNTLILKIKDKYLVSINELLWVIFTITFVYGCFVVYSFI